MRVTATPAHGLALPAHGPALSVATLISWLLTASVGAYMVRRVAARGGFREQRAVRDGLHPGVLVGHFSLALTGLLSWVCFLASGWRALAWLGVALLMPAIGLGICTVTLWTPFPRSPGPPQAGAVLVTPPPADSPPPGIPQPGRPGRQAAPGGPRGRLTDAVLAQALTDEALAARLIDDVIDSLPAHAAARGRKRPTYPVAIIPFGHGMGAVATFVLAVMSAIGAH
jgi:hypothetical protein